MDKRTNGVRINRRQDILHAAAKYFKERGYAATTMRDIAEHVQIKTASLYYHFPSKAELLLAVYEESAVQLSTVVSEAIKGIEDPWERLQVACTTHLQNVLGGSDYVQVVMSDVPSGIEPELRIKLTIQRDIYENVFRAIIAQLPLAPQRNAKYFLLALLGALAWTRVWYKPGGDTPAQIAENILKIFR